MFNKYTCMAQRMHDYVSCVVLSLSSFCREFNCLWELHPGTRYKNCDFSMLPSLYSVYFFLNELAFLQSFF